jgi:hypothetical protein
MVAAPMAMMSGDLAMVFLFPACSVFWMRGRYARKNPKRKNNSP